MRSIQIWGTGALALVAVLGTSVAGAANADGKVPKKPTFSHDVAPILFANCVTCHRPGQIGPMSLRTYDEVRPWAKSIAKYVGDGTMPPWHADEGFGPWKNDRALTEVEKQTIVRWAKRGALEGAKSDLPIMPVYGDGDWQLGEPDYIIEFDQMDLEAGGRDQFRNFEVPTDFGEDRWLEAVEIVPGNRKVVHHVILWQGGANNPSGWIGAWAAGADPLKFPAKTGRLLKEGAPIIGDFHYHPADTAEVDTTRVGLHFADEGAVEKQLVNLWVMNASFEIPAGDDNYGAESSFTFAQDSHILGLAPHMHYRGKDFSYTMTYPDGRTKDLLKVSKYDFNWQTTYEFETPIAAPKGARIDCVAHWDNSADNPSNPDPTKNVRFGNESYDEMMIGFVDYIVDEGIRPAPVVSPVLAKLDELIAQYPGEIYRVDMQTVPGQGLQPSGLHLPREGEGGWHVEFGGLVGKARVFDIVWDGNAFEAKASIPGAGEHRLSGEVDPATGALQFTITTPGGDTGTMEGHLVTSEATGD